MSWSLQGGLNPVGEENLFWNLAETAAPDAGFDSDASWLELYLKPGVNFRKRISSDSTFYGRLSAVASFTASTDAFDATDTGRVTLEEAYLGYRASSSAGLSFDVSLGARELRLGTGMLISNGGSSGFERGALKFGPRKAWERSAIARLSKGALTATAFYLDPNELESNDTETAQAGVDWRWDPSDGVYLGLTYVHVLESEAPYPQAAPGGVGPPTVTTGAREDLNAANLYAGARPFEGALSGLFLRSDLAYQWNDRIDLEAWGGRVQAGVEFSSARWAPTLTYSYQAFSGDDPDTTRLERFDPLQFEGSPSAWATGSKSSMVFINSNLRAHQLSLRLQHSKRHATTLRYAHIRVDEERSPIQFGQATRVDFGDGVATVISGVTDAHLADDFFVEYSQTINPNTFLTAGVSLSVPGEGIERVAEGGVPDWTGGFINVVFNY
ncbi:MAG: alginate export family protein [Acidobacteriota bacterium]